MLSAPRCYPVIRCPDFGMTMTSLEGLCRFLFAAVAYHESGAAATTGSKPASGASGLELLRENMDCLNLSLLDVRPPPAAAARSPVISRSVPLPPSLFITSSSFVSFQGVLDL